MLTSIELACNNFTTSIAIISIELTSITITGIELTDTDNSFTTSITITNMGR